MCGVKRFLGWAASVGALQALKSTVPAGKSLTGQATSGKDPAGISHSKLKSRREWVSFHVLGVTAAETDLLQPCSPEGDQRAALWFSQDSDSHARSLGSQLRFFILPSPVFLSHTDFEKNLTSVFLSKC